MMPPQQLRIAAIAWGSLTWDASRPLNRRSEWHSNGPILPVEFAKVTADDKKNQARVSLVLLPGATPVTTYWTEIDFPTLEMARAQLVKVEGAGGRDPLSKIGYWSATKAPFGRLPNVIAEIGSWASSQGLDGAVWTDFKPNLPTKDALEFSFDLLPAVISRIESYRDHPTWFAEARDYVERAPHQIVTCCRGALNEHFGWKYRGEQ